VDFQEIEYVYLNGNFLAKHPWDRAHFTKASPFEKSLLLATATSSLTLSYVHDI
jgi:hypothetical protein